MNEHDYFSLILYYGRSHLYYSMQKTALDGISKYPGNTSFRLFNGIAMTLGNRVQEAIRELNPLKNENDLSFAAILGLIYAHKRCNIVDKEAIVNLDSKLKEEKKYLTSNSSYNAAVFLFLSGKIEKAKEYSEKAIRLNSQNIDAQVLKGWAELYLNPRASKSLLEVFERAVLVGRNIDASLGIARYYQLNHDFESAVSILNKLSVQFPELNVPLIEKMETQLSSWNWDHAFETALRILNLEPGNISALRMKCLLLICREGKIPLGLQALKQLLLAIDKNELNNCKLVLQTCQLFGKICGRDRDILNFTLKNMERIVQHSPGTVEFIVELGYQNILLGNFKDAVKHFRSATKIDDSSIYALCGLTLCQIAENGITDQVRQQIEFLNEIQGIDKIPLLLFMTGKIEENSDKAVQYLIDASEVHFKNLKTLSFGHEYLLRFDPDFLLQLVDELLQHSPVQTTVKVGVSLTKEILHITLKQSLNILEAIVKACPGLTKAMYMLAKVHFLCGEISLASMTLNRILNEINPSYTNAHLLNAQIYIQQKQFQNALQCLEICLSQQFSVRENPLYHLLNGIVQKNYQQLEDAQKSFTTALSLIGFKSRMIISGNVKVSSPAKLIKNNGKKPTLTLADKVTLFLELIDTFIQIKQDAEAEKFLKIAFDEFDNTSEVGRLSIASAELLIKQGNVNKAIDILKNIQISQQYYIQAKTRLAEIYLHHRKDKLSFAQCFKELVENRPEPESYLMMGDAYMTILEPELAIEAYQAALKRNPRDSLLASKLGRAYVKTHQYAKAINYYLEATMNPDHVGLKLDLAELYLKLKQYSNAEQVLVDEIEIKKL